MPPINPEQLLKALGPLLTDNGGIKGPEEASRIIRLMKVATKLVNKCIYLNILRVTESQEALEKFTSLGGWDTLNLWLDTARNNNNNPLVGELLEVYLNLPVTVVLLKQNSAAKTIKQLSKTEDNKIKTLSGQLVERWTQKIRDQRIADDNEEKKKKKKHKEKEKEKDKDKEKKENKDENDSSEKLKNRDSSDKNSSKKHHSSRDRDRKDRDSKDRDSKEKEIKDKDSKNRDKDRDRHKDKNRHDKIRSSSDSKETLTNNTHSPADTAKSGQKEAVSVNGKESSNHASKNSLHTAAEDDENKKRPKTVRKVGDKFRSTGLFDDDNDDEDNNETESLKKKFGENSAPGAALKRAGVDKTDEITDKKPRLHLTMPQITPTSLDGTSISSTTPPEVTHGRIKLIAPKKAQGHEIHESNVFMNSLQQSSSYTHGAIKRKKKLTTTSPSPVTPTSLLKHPPPIIPPSLSTPSPSLQTTVPSPTMKTSEPVVTSPPILSPTTVMAQRLPSVPSFYRDTLEDLPEPKEPEKPKPVIEEKEDGPPQLEMMEIDPPTLEKEKPTESAKEPKESESGALPIESKDDVMDIDDTQRSNRPKKKVSWAVEHRLEQVFYFEMDETERENVNRPKSFNQMKKEEMMLDRRAMESAKRLVNDNMVEVLQWHYPKLIENAISVVEIGCNSVEKEIQMEREKGVLCALFFNKVPDTPIEPEPDIPTEQADTKDIPLEDENGSCTVYEHVYSQNDPSSLPYDPEFDHPMPNQGPMPPFMGGAPNTNNPNMPMAGGMNGPPMSNGGGVAGGFNNMMPTPMSHLLNTLQQQAMENRDPVLANMQSMLAKVVQNTNPQDSNLLMERILSTVEPFRHQVPGLNNLMNSVVNGNDGGNPRGFMGNQGPPRVMGPPRHGLLGPHPPGFNMMPPVANNPRPPNMPGPPGPQGPAGPGPMPGGAPGDRGHGDRGPVDRGHGDRGHRDRGGHGGGGFFGDRDRDRDNRGGGGQWRGKGSGGGHRPFNKRGRGRSQVCQHYIKNGCKYGDSCGFLHPPNYES